jgi:hypothetical protein
VKNTRIVAAITAALVGGFVLGGMGIASASSSAPHAPSVASPPATGMMTSATWMHTSQPTTTTATPAVPKHRASAAHATHKASATHATHQSSTTSHATHRTATSSTSHATHRCSTTCTIHHLAASESHDGTSGENHSGCND